MPVAVRRGADLRLILGAPTLRVRGDYLAIVTLGFGEIVRLTASTPTGSARRAGITDVPRPAERRSLFDVPHLDWSAGPPVVDLDNQTTFLKFGISDQIPYYWLALMVIIVVMFVDKLIKDSRVGRAWEATREDEDAAELMGVPTFRFKLLAFAMGAFIGGLSGALFAGKQGFISPDSFPLLLSILFVAAVVVGGQGNRWGVIVGGVVVAYLPGAVPRVPGLARARLRPGADGCWPSSGRRVCCRPGVPSGEEGRREARGARGGHRQCLRTSETQPPAEAAAPTARAATASWRSTTSRSGSAAWSRSTR